MSHWRRKFRMARARGDHLDRLAWWAVIGGVAFMFAHLLVHAFGPILPVHGLKP